ncbi:phosphate/phosphite/phosphonate ABC transporter substrate-binding protein [Vacuolonema iberomarrocanum]|uniref:phosphate/phosphite/phosphonate ABC transporter substrate-binding protein n=1 Tax=Vacuolonema iberomarrocanum TaxID=3454632 RepID=UPI001A0F6195|nr:PhnD/SsuA/transferrin family substrate-binding protein [filamentous cyanobacterium LEGE 07170]
MNLSRRHFMQGLLAVSGFSTTLMGGCASSSSPGSTSRLIVGIVNYEAGEQSLEAYQPFQTYLAEQTQGVVELEPVFNELKALEQIQRQIWSLVFAPPGLAAIAIAETQYAPLFPLQGPNVVRSVIVVRQESAIASLGDLANQTIALGTPGSVTGYYLPLYDLYGLTLEEIRFAPTPRTVLEWLAANEVVAGALSEDDYQTYRSEFGNAFRVLHTSRGVAPGAVLIAPTVERNLQNVIEQAMASAPSNIATDAGYIANAPLPDYAPLIELLAKVRPLEANVKQTPAILTLEPQT